jgi:hypothetical protein
MIQNAVLSFAPPAALARSSASAVTRALTSALLQAAFCTSCFPASSLARDTKVLVLMMMMMLMLIMIVEYDDVKKIKK